MIGQHRTDSLPEGWARPAPDIGRSLISEPVDEALAELRVARDDVRRWRRLDWLSFDADELDRLDLSQQTEIDFIRSLAVSGLGEIVLGHLLEGLRRPFAYHNNRIAYSFTHGWVMHVEKDPYDVVEENALGWLEELASTGEIDKLRSLRDRIVGHLDNFLGNDNTDQPDD